MSGWRTSFRRTSFVVQKKILYCETTITHKISFWCQKLSQFEKKIVSQNKAKNAGRSGENAGNTSKCGISHMIAGWLIPMLCARVAQCFPGSPAMARDGELIQTQYFRHHADTICHPNSSYVTNKLYETLECGCNKNTIIQNEIFSRFLPSTYVAWQRRNLCDAAKVARWRH